MHIELSGLSLRNRNTLVCGLLNKSRLQKVIGILLVLYIAYTTKQTHRERYTDSYRETNRTIHIHKFILTPPIMSSQELFVLP